MRGNDFVERNKRLGQFPLCLQDFRSTGLRHRNCLAVAKIDGISERRFRINKLSKI